MTGHRIESVVQVGILLVMGGMAGAASFTHIHDLTVSHGQPSWIGWANAIVVELMSVASGLESRRRKRTGQATGFVHTVLAAAVAVSLAAQVAEAERSVWGWTVAALPALGFLAVVKIVLSRTPMAARPDQAAAGVGAAPVGVVDCGPADTGIGPADVEVKATALDAHRQEPVFAEQDGLSSIDIVRLESADGPGPAVDSEVDHSAMDRTVPAQRNYGDNELAGPATTRTDDESHSPRSGWQVSSFGPVRVRSALVSPRPDRTGPDDDLLELGKTIAVKVAMRNDKLTRQVLIDEIRRVNRTIGTDRASELLRQIRQDVEAPVGTD